MVVKPGMDHVLGVRINRTENPGEYLKRQLTTHPQLDLETPGAKALQGDFSEGLGSDGELLAHGVQGRGSYLPGGGRSQSWLGLHG